MQVYTDYMSLDNAEILKDIEVSSYKESIQVKNKLISESYGKNNMTVSIFASDNDIELLPKYIINSIRCNNKIERPIEWCRSFDSYGILLTQDVSGYNSSGKYIRYIFDYSNLELSNNDIVYCECTKTFHIFHKGYNEKTDLAFTRLTDFTRELDQICDYMPKRYLKKVPRYVIDELDLGILYEFDKRVQDSAPTYEYNYEDLKNKYLSDHPWLKV